MSVALELTEMTKLRLFTSFHLGDHKRTTCNKLNTFSSRSVEEGSVDKLCGRGYSTFSKMADEEELTAKQKKNKKKKLEAKKKKQEQKEKDCISDVGLEKAAENKTLQEMLDEELSWCINQLEIGLIRQKTDKNLAQRTQNIIQTLRSPKTPLPKKRQIMHSVFGDYRKKIQEDKKKIHKIESEKPFKVFSVKKNQLRSVFLKVARHCRESSSGIIHQGNLQKVSSSLNQQTSWKFELSSVNDFRFNFNEPE